MRRLLVLAFLLASVLWQSLTPVAARAGFGGAGDIAHALLHWQDEGHHHHDDGSVHADESADSLAHVQLDGALSGIALPVHGPLPVAALHGPAPESRLQIHLPTPPPHALRRPPRLNA